MQIRELVGYALAILAMLIAAGGVWAARYYSPTRKYDRIRARERKAARERERSKHRRSETIGHS